MGCFFTLSSKGRSHFKRLIPNLPSSISRRIGHYRESRCVPWNSAHDARSSFKTTTLFGSRNQALACKMGGWRNAANVLGASACHNRNTRHSFLGRRGTRTVQLPGITRSPGQFLVAGGVLEECMLRHLAAGATHIWHRRTSNTPALPVPPSSQALVAP